MAPTRRPKPIEPKKCSVKRSKSLKAKKAEISKTERQATKLRIENAVHYIEIT